MHPSFALLLAIWLGGGNAAPLRVSVRDFGAKGDGITDDAPAMQRAIDHVSQTGGIVEIPKSAGPYLLGRGLVVGASRVELVGTGGPTLRLMDGAGADGTVHVIQIAGSEGNPVRNVRARDLVIDANYWNQPGANRPRAIDCRWAEEVLIERVELRRPWVGLTFGRGTRDAEAHDCLVTQWHNDGFDVSADGVTGGASQIRFVRCLAAGSPDEAVGGLAGQRDDAFEIEDGCAEVELVECLAADAGGKGFGVRNHQSKNPLVISGIRFLRCEARNLGRLGWLIRGNDGQATVQSVRLEDCAANVPLAICGGIDKLSLERCRFAAPVRLGLGEVPRPEPLPPAWPVRSAEFIACRLSDLEVNLHEGEHLGATYLPRVLLCRTNLSGRISRHGATGTLVVTRDNSE